MSAQENHVGIVEHLLNNGADQGLSTDVSAILHRSPSSRSFVLLIGRVHDPESEKIGI